MAYQYIQLDYLETMAGGDRATRRLFLQMLADELESSQAKLKALWESRNRKELLWLCHHLKSTFPFVGNEQLARANREAERLLKQNAGFEKLQPLVLNIQTLIPKALAEVRRELKDN